MATTRTPVPSCTPEGACGVLRGRAADLAHVLVQQVFEHRAAFLEAVGADVGEVVGRDREVRLLRVESGLGCPQCWIHVILLRVSAGASASASI